MAAPNSPARKARGPVELHRRILLNSVSCPPFSTSNGTFPIILKPMTIRTLQNHCAVAYQ
jgi:hypothetical protein